MPKGFFRDICVFVACTVAAYGVIAGMASLSPLFGITSFKVQGWTGHLLAALIAIVVGFICSYFILRKQTDTVEIQPDTPTASSESLPRKADEQPGKILAETIQEQFAVMQKSQSFSTIVRIGGPLSRALWLEGRYEARIAIGKIVEDAAYQVGKNEERIQALIDDIGWTLVIIGDIPEAEKNINRGVEIAEQHGFFYFAAKGYRHLGGIAIRRGDLAGSLQFLKKAEEVAERIQDDTKKREMLAGIRHGQAEAQVMSGDFDAAVSHCKEAQAIFHSIRDEARLVKTYSLMGRIYQGKHKWFEAKDEYRKGLREARAINRMDEIRRNLIGLAYVAQEEKEWTVAADFINQLKEMRESTPILLDLESLDDKVKELERRQLDAG